MPKKGRCFVISPIGEDGSSIRNHADFFFEKIVLEVLSRASINMEASRADKFHFAEMITERIFSEILHSDLVIADITYHNPNVFYELAVSHFLRKKVVVCKTPTTKIPFDTNNFRILNIDIDGRDYSRIIACQNELESFILATLQSKKLPRNPITSALGNYSIKIRDGNDKLIEINESDILRTKLRQIGHSEEELVELISKALRVYEIMKEAEETNAEIYFRNK